MLRPMHYRTLNPANEKVLDTFPLATSAEVEQSLERSHKAQRNWRETPISERSARVGELAEVLASAAGELASLMATEMGKPLEQGSAEITKCAWVCRYFAGAADKMLEPSPRDSDGSESFVRYDALGPILAIMPWNFPFWQFYRFAAPALMAGNTVLLKHSPNTPGAARAIVNQAARAGFPEGVVQSLFLDNAQAASVIADARVRGVTLTGSTRAGRDVAAQAGRCLKPLVLELGGSDPFIVFADADVAEAARVGVEARCLNSGQSCIAAKRFLVQKSVAPEFIERIVTGMQARVMGDPLEAEVDIGPLARADLRDHLAAQVHQSLDSGAQAHCGGAPHDGTGFFYPPTVLSGVEPGTPAADDELFGPVAAVMTFKNDDQAVELANATRYGLGASVWTADVQRALDIARRIDAGSVFVNGLVKSDPRLPFGGVKESGFGRELSQEGILEFVNAKTVWVR